MSSILVDPSSLANLLQMLAYKPMGYSPSTLENPRHPLSRFNGATTTFLGDVVLPIQADPVTLSVQFSMVDDFSLCNAIKRCPWLHKMKVIPFTYHQMVSYLTKVRQVNLLGSQLTV